MLYRTPKKLGEGAEGKVYKIAPKLVKKDWGGYNENHYDLLIRIKTVQETYHKLPPFLKGLFRMPEFAGYEFRRGGQVTTYHEFIKAEKLSSYWTDGRILALEKKLELYFADTQLHYGFCQSRSKKGTNVLYSKGKFWLVDCMDN